MHHLEPIDGIVGDETWASLRLEPEARPAGTDGRDPHTFTEHGIKLRFTTEGSYYPDDDWLWCRAFSVGDTETPAENLTVTASPWDTALVPLSNVVFGGTGSLLLLGAPGNNGLT